jgi:8-oxo-dGTP pyrophosphatase MutT (NUDIX family)
MSFERIDSKTVWEGQIATVHVDRVRYDDGDEADRERVSHPGAVAVVAHDGERLFLVRQPREAVDEQSLLELPAGKLDAEGEGPLETAKRELAEEIGKGARTWRHLTTFYTSPGFVEEVCHVYVATDLYDESAEAEEDERIEIVEAPLAELDAVIEGCHDAKTLVGLLWFRAFCA